MYCIAFVLTVGPYSPYKCTNPPFHRHDQWLPRCRSNIGIRNVIVGSFLLVLNSMALYKQYGICYVT